MNFLWSQTKLINPFGNICDFIAIMFRQGYQQKNNLDYWLGTHLQLGNTMAPTSSEDFIRQLLCKDIGWIHTSSWVSLGKTSPARSQFAVFIFMAGVLAGYTCNISSGLCLDAHHATIYASSWVILVIPTSIEVL